MYLDAHTRPDFSVMASMLQTHVATPCRVHILMSKSTMKYLCETSNGMSIPSPGHGEEVMAFVDASYGSQYKKGWRS